MVIAGVVLGKKGPCETLDWFNTDYDDNFGIVLNDDKLKMHNNKPKTLHILIFANNEVSSLQQACVWLPVSHKCTSSFKKKLDPPFCL